MLPQQKVSDAWNESAKPPFCRGNSRAGGGGGAAGGLGGEGGEGGGGEGTQAVQKTPTS